MVEMESGHLVEMDGDLDTWLRWSLDTWLR